MSAAPAIPSVLTIAGTDPSGGAGIQADLKTIAALGGYGLSAITAVVAQNGAGVRALQPLPADLVAAQIEAAFDEAPVDAVKIGLLADPGIVRAVAAALGRHRPRHVVLDPVMVASAGQPLLAAAALEVLRAELLPLTTLLTPNLAEAGVLLGRPAPADAAAMRDCLAGLQALGPGWVLLKGGHLSTSAESTDLLAGPGGAVTAHAGPRITTTNDHGTGCTLSAAIATLLPQQPPVAAVAGARAYLQAALAAADALQRARGGAPARGRGPLDHFHALRGR